MAQSRDPGPTNRAAQFSSVGLHLDRVPELERHRQGLLLVRVLKPNRDHRYGRPSARMGMHSWGTRPAKPIKRMQTGRSRPEQGRRPEEPRLPNRCQALPNRGRSAPGLPDKAREHTR